MEEKEDKCGVWGPIEFIDFLPSIVQEDLYHFNSGGGTVD